MLTLYQFSSCPFCCKVRALLNHTKQPYQTIEVTPFGTPELHFTDHKKVPVLRDDEKTIVESAQIIDYINEHYSQLKVNNDTQQWTKWIDHTLVHYLPPLIHPNFSTSFRNFAHIIKDGQFNWFKGKIIRLMGSFVMPRVATKMKAKYNIENPEKEFLNAIDHWVDHGLAGKAFFGNEQADLVDCSVFGVLRSSEALGIVDLAKSHNAQFSQWYGACRTSMND
ncbi:MAG: glutathione S-transferase N-terminal domain-containing protein [Cocleimonas sp.]|nr:glutathione S-transferase N-terminal domain-containing protein [Cocleimonas sp.]